MQFASDTWSGAAPEIVQAVAEEAEQYSNAYGGSQLDREVQARFSEIFERDVAVFFTATGTAANTLALASVARPAGVVFCHGDSHILEEEVGAIELLAGARVIAVGGGLGQLDPNALRRAIARFEPESLRNGQPFCVSITQQSELGTAYAQEAIRRISAIARERGLALHMDGARFANALVELGVTPAEMTWKAGIDILSFGATKNGCIAAEAVVFFHPEMARETPFLRKRAGHFFSKSRFVAAQFDAYFRNDLWLRLARHANKMADRLRAGFAAAPNARPAWPTRGNEVFAVLTRADAARLKKLGALCYDWPQPGWMEPSLGPDEVLVRLVAAFSTGPDEVDSFLSALAG
jgi:threonine aldolase